MFSKLLIYGESWPGCHGRLLLDELHSRGHEAEIFDHTNFMPGIKSRSLFQRIKRRIFTDYYSSRIRKQFWKKIKEYDPSSILICKGLNLDSTLLKKIRRKGYFIINWNPDDFFNPLNSNKQLIESIPEYDLIISSRRHLFEEYKNFGAKEIMFLNWYYVKDLHKKEGLDIVYDVSFVGSWSKRREEIISQLPSKVNIWGGGWHKASRKFKHANNVNLEILSQTDMSKVFEQSKFNLNFLTSENRDYTNLRLFEVPASNGLLVTERTSDSQDILTDSVDCIMFSDTEELIQRLNSENQTKFLVTRGYERITNSNHEFSDRVDSIIDYLDERTGLNQINQKN